MGTGLRVLRADGEEGRAFLRELALRRAQVSADAEAVVRPILAAVQERGDAALAEYARRFDGASLTPATVRVAPEEVERAFDHLAPEVIEAPQGLLLSVKSEGQEHLIPFRAGIVRRVDREARMVTVTPPAGLLEL